MLYSEFWVNLDYRVASCLKRNHQAKSENLEIFCFKVKWSLLEHVLVNCVPLMEKIFQCLSSITLATYFIRPFGGGEIYRTKVRVYLLDMKSNIRKIIHLLDLYDGIISLVQKALLLTYCANVFLKS